MGKTTVKKVKSAEQKADFVHLSSEHVKKMKGNSEKRPNPLVARLRAGDRGAAAELVDIYYEQIYLFLRRLGHNRQISEDLTQEAFLRAWYHINQLRDDRALKGWLYRIAGNVSKLYWRKHKRMEAALRRGFEASENNEADDDNVVRNEQFGRLKGAVAKLPWKFRQVIVLHYMQHLTIAEAAEAVGIREGTFKSRLSRALAILRKQDI